MAWRAAGLPRIPGATDSKSHAYEYDATEIDSVKFNFQAIEQILGPISVLLTIAGLCFQNVEEASFDDFEASWRTKRPRLCSWPPSVLPQLRSTTTASIVVPSAVCCDRGGKFCAFRFGPKRPSAACAITCPAVGAGKIHVANDG